MRSTGPVGGVPGSLADATRIEGDISASVTPGNLQKRSNQMSGLLASGGALLQAIQAARNAQLHVSHAQVIVDRQEQEGKQKVEAQGVSLISLLTMDDLKAAQPDASFTSDQ